MTAKALVLEIVRGMPDDLTLEDVIEELEFRKHIDEGLRQLDAGEGIPHEQVKERFAKWLN